MTLETPPTFAAEHLEQAIASPGAVVLQSGRNLTVRTTLERPGAPPVDAVVKRFPAPSAARALLNRLRGVPGKATRAFAAAQHLHRANPGLTPEPVAALETLSGGKPGPGWLVTRYEPGMTSFRARLIELYAANGPCERIMALLQTVAEACARMHDAGFMHRDLGNQNIMLAEREGRATPAVLVVDLNRARLVAGPLGTWSRARDLSRISLPSDFLRVFLEMYWRGATPPRRFLRAERLFRRLFALHCATRNLRHPLRKRSTSSEGEYPAPRDLWIWDAKSEQAVSTLRSRDRHRHQSHSRVTAPLLALLMLSPRYLRKRRLLRALEVCIQTQKPFSSFQQHTAKERAFTCIKIGIRWERNTLYDRINQRVDTMVAQGLVEEAQKLYAWRELTALRTVGYQEIFEYMNGQHSLATAIDLIKQHSRNYAKRQETWFRREKDVHWFDFPSQREEIFTFLEKR